MPGADSAQREGDTPTPSSDTFEFKSLDHLSLVEYQCPSSSPTRSVAKNFFKGGAASPATSATDPSTADGRVAEDDFDDFKQDSPEPGHDWPSSHVDASWNSEDLVIILKRKLDRANKQLAQSENELASANKKLMSTEKTLNRMHKQNVHFAQELAAAVVTQLKGCFHPPQIDQGLVPFLVHSDSTPLIKKRITFATDFDRAPKVIVGMQTGDPSAMALVCALDVDDKGFTVHADLINHSKSSLAARAELMKCQVSWMAFESIDPSFPRTAVDRWEGRSKRPRL